MADSETLQDDEFLGDISEMIEYYHTLNPSDGKALAKAVTSQVRERYQGERVRIRKRRCHKHSAAIRSEFNGQNLKEIMERYRVSRSTIYRICNTSKK